MLWEKFIVKIKKVKFKMNYVSLILTLSSTRLVWYFFFTNYGFFYFILQFFLLCFFIPVQKMPCQGKVHFLAFCFFSYIDYRLINFNFQFSLLCLLFFTIIVFEVSSPSLSEDVSLLFSYSETLKIWRICCSRYEKNEIM